MSYEDDNSDDGFSWSIEYLTHDSEYTKEEFENICDKAKEISREGGEVLLYDMAKILVDQFGFKELQIKSFYEFEEEWK